MKEDLEPKPLSVPDWTDADDHTHRVWKAVKELLKPYESQEKLKWAVWACIRPKTERELWLGLEWCASWVFYQLAEGNSEALARFGRIADKAGESAKDADYPGSQEMGVYCYVEGITRHQKRIPTKEELLELDGRDFEFSERTVQRCFNRIGEESGLSLDSRDSVNVWTHPPS